MTPKFRVWDDEAKELAQVRYIEFLGDGDCHVGFNGYELIVEPEDNLLVQYTGIKDKTGMEIYDGDNIQYSKRTINGAVFIYVCRVFKHESGTWRIEGYLKDDPSYKTKGTLYEVRNLCEVVGNKFENL